MTLIGFIGLWAGLAALTLLVVMLPSGAWAAVAEPEATAAPTPLVARSALLPRTENVAAKMVSGVPDSTVARS